MPSLDLVIIERAGLNYLEEVKCLLQETGLPVDGLGDHFEAVLIARRGKEILGCAALENYGQTGLLRSVAVDRDWRGRGLGSQLVDGCLQLARDQGLLRIYLLTETAVPYFREFGFQTIGRGKVDRAVAQSVEFKVACPETAQAMILVLRSG